MKSHSIRLIHEIKLLSDKLSIGLNDSALNLVSNKHGVRFDWF